MPLGFRWIWSHFLYIWMNTERDFNGNVMFTFRTVNEYQECFGIRFSIFEKQLLFKMKRWTQETIYNLENPSKKDKK